MGGDSNGVPFKDFAWEEWKSKYGTSPPWGKKEFVQLYDARQRLDTEELARAAWTKFMQSTDPFHEGHSPGQFLYSLSKMTARAVKAIPKPKQAATFPGAERAAKMVAILKEVEADDTIPATMKRDEMAKRWKGITTIS
jgi:hypothetical protein